MTTSIISVPPGPAVNGETDRVRGKREVIPSKDWAVGMCDFSFELSWTQARASGFEVLEVYLVKRYNSSNNFSNVLEHHALSGCRSSFLTWSYSGITSDIKLHPVAEPSYDNFLIINLKTCLSILPELQLLSFPFRKFL